jgi:hypothetical protein
MAVQNAEAPRRADEEACAGKEDADEKNREFALLSVEARGDGFDEPRRGENTEKTEHGSAKGEKCGNGAGSFSSFFLIVSRKKVGVNGNEGSGENAFTKKILQEVGDAQGGFEDIGRVGIAKIVGEHAIADQSRDAAQKNASGY